MLFIYLLIPLEEIYIFIPTQSYIFSAPEKRIMIKVKWFITTEPVIRLILGIINVIRLPSKSERISKRKSRKMFKTKSHTTAKPDIGKTKGIINIKLFLSRKKRRDSPLVIEKAQGYDKGEPLVEALWKIRANSHYSVSTCVINEKSHRKDRVIIK